MVFEYKTNEQGHYVCDICGSVKTRQNTMHYHLQRHEGTKNYSCTYANKGCTKKFYQKYALDEHVKMSHSSVPVEPTIKCSFPDCTSAFHKKDAYRIHIARTHLKDRIKDWIVKNDDSTVAAYSCDVCKVEYKSYPAILYHVMDHAKEDAALKEKLRGI